MSLSPKRLRLVALTALGAAPGCGANADGYLKDEPAVADLAGVWILDRESRPNLSAHGATVRDSARIDLKPDGTYEITDIPNFDQLDGSPLSASGKWSVIHWEKDDDSRWCVRFKIPSGFGRMMGYSFPLFIVGNAKPEALIAFLDKDKGEVVRYVRQK